MTVCTFYEQLGKFLGNRKNNEFPGRFMEITGREGTTSIRKSFSSRNGRPSVCVFLLQLQLNLQNERDRSLLKTTAHAGCHETMALRYGQNLQATK